MHTVVVTVNNSKPSFFLEVAVFFQLSTNKLLVHTSYHELPSGRKY